MISGTILYEIENAPKRLCLKLLDKAVLHACNFLDINHIQFLIEFNSLEKYVHGFCEYDLEDGSIKITIAKQLSPEQIVRTLLHEFVHVKQYIDKRLIPGYVQTWDGIKIEDAYHNLPWEIEAYRMEEEMMKELKDAY